ncbi:MAG: hydroxyacylglutathione hydrolase [Porticoccaceae bacterium]|nr:hydroxyacylglutathione hydrolase [Porticoccaceae bacterium]
MIIEQIWTNNAWRNFNYLIVCPETGDAMAIDPLDHQQCLDVANKQGWTITKILNTHEHHDHIEGNKPLVQATGAELLAHIGAQGAISDIDTTLVGGEVITVGTTVELQVIDTPGHTMSHVCLLSKTSTPVLFSGDTLFNAGAGNCHGGGHPEALYTTFSDIFSKLPDETQIYPGHDYIVNNLQFTLDREPDNKVARNLLKQVEIQDTNNPLVTTIELEKQINCFLRLDNHEIVANLKDSVANFPDKPTPKEVFLALRALRNDW